MFWEEDVNTLASPPSVPFFRINPAVRLLTGITVGIAIGLVSAWSSLGFIYAVSILAVAVFILALFSRKNPTLRAPAYWSGAIACGLFVAFNAEETSIRTPDKILPEMKGMLSGRVESMLRSDSTSLRCIVAGSADPQPLPRINNVRVLLQIYRLSAREKALTVGSHITADVIFHVPRQATLPNEFDESRYCRSLGTILAARVPAGKTSILGQESGLRAWSHQASETISRAINNLYSPDIAPLMNALLLGDKTHVPPQIRQNYAVTGTAHVMAVSGLHVGVIIAVLWLPIAYIPNRWLRLVLMISAITVFVLISGIQPSAIRSAIMATVMLTARAFERRTTILNAVCFAAIVMLLADASLLFSAGFQMSFAAVAGLGIFLPPFQNFFRNTLRLKRGILAFTGDSLAVTFAASAITSVLVAVWFGIFSAVSPLANLIVVPLTSFAMILGVVAVLLYPITLGAASIFAAAAQFCMEISIYFNEFLAGFEGASLGPSIAIWAATASSCVTVYIFTSRSLRQTAFRFTVCILMLTVCSPLFLGARVVKADAIAVARNDMTALFLAPINNRKYVVLTDRKPHQKPRNDNGLIGCLSALPDPLVIIYRGNISEWNSVQTKRIRNLIMLPMTENIRRAADSLIGQPLSQYNSIH